MIEQARAEPVQVEKYGRPVVVVLSVEEFQRLSSAPSYGKHLLNITGQ
nr:hypothetical protein [Nisaea denitrificans]